MYALLHYRGDKSELAAGLKVARSDGGAERTVPVLLGADAVDLPYEVLDVELTARPKHYDEARDRPCPGSTTYSPRDLDAACDTCGGRTGTAVMGPVVRSTVHLGPASADTVRGNRSAAYHQREQNLAQLVDHARVRHYWRPDVWAAPATDQSRAALEERLAATEAAKRAKASA